MSEKTTKLAEFLAISEDAFTRGAKFGYQYALNKAREWLVINSRARGATEDGIEEMLEIFDNDMEL